MARTRIEQQQPGVRKTFAALVTSGAQRAAWMDVTWPSAVRAPPPARRCERDVCPCGVTRRMAWRCRGGAEPPRRARSCRIRDGP